MMLRFVFSLHLCWARARRAFPFPYPARSSVWHHLPRTVSGSVSPRALVSKTKLYLASFAENCFISCIYPCLLSISNQQILSCQLILKQMITYYLSSDHVMIPGVVTLFGEWSGQLTSEIRYRSKAPDRSVWQNGKSKWDETREPILLGLPTTQRPYVPQVSNYLKYCINYRGVYFPIFSLFFPFCIHASKRNANSRK